MYFIKSCRRLLHNIKEMFSEILTSSHPCWFSHCLDDGHSINNGNLTSYTIGIIVRWWWFDYQALQNSHKLILNCTGPHRAIKCEERSWKHSKLKFANALLQIQLWSCEYHNKEARKQFTVAIHGYEFVACCAFDDLSCTLPYEEFDFFHWAPDAHFLVHQSFLNEFLKHLLPNRIALNDGIFTGFGMTALVIMFMRTSSATVKGSFTMRMSRSLLTFCSYRCSTEGDASWWRVCFVDTIPANVSASFDKRLNSDAIKNHLAMAAGCCVSPFRPPWIFMILFTCSMAWSGPIAQNSTSFLLTQKLPAMNSAWISGSVDSSCFIWVRYNGTIRA